jgi:hypothetical protein
MDDDQPTPLDSPEGYSTAERAAALATLGAAILLGCIAVDILRPRRAAAEDDSTGE